MAAKRTTTRTKSTPQGRVLAESKTPAAPKAQAAPTAPATPAAPKAQAAPTAPATPAASKAQAAPTAPATPAAPKAQAAPTAPATPTSRTKQITEPVSTFQERFDQRYDEMKYLYAELYNNNMEAFNYFCDTLRYYNETRSTALQRLDHQRLREIEWYKDRSIMGMQVYTECFAGDLKGVMGKIDYLKDCGVHYLHLMPLLASPKGASDGGYAVSDFRTVEPSLGTMEDLAELTKLCHENGISVCLDFVLNHASDQHEWAIRAKQGDKDCQDRYFFYDNWDVPNYLNETMPEVFPQTAPGSFSWCHEAGKVVMTTFHHYQWDLNYANPTVMNDMTSAMLNLINQGVDIMRLDAIPYIWKELGTNCRNLPQVHNITRLLHIAAEIVAPSAMLLGEVVMEPDKVVPYFGSIEKPECHMLYNVTTMATTWHTVATKDVRLMKHQLEALFALPTKFTFLNYLRCHDDIGWGLDYDYLKQFGVEEVAHKAFLNAYLRGQNWDSPSRGEIYNDDPVHGDARLCGTTASLCGIEAAEFEQNQPKLQWCIDLDVMLHAFLLSLSGLPIIYSGDEIGQLNDYGYHNEPDKWEDSRYLHRGHFNWDDAAKRKDPTTRPGKLFLAIRHLMETRASHNCFSHKADTWVHETGNDHVLGIGRFYQQEKLIAVFNFNSGDEHCWIPDDQEYVDLTSGETVRGGDLLLHGHEYRWLLKDYTK